MANVPFSVTVPNIHQGPGYWFYNTLAPADGANMLIDLSGNPQNPAASTWASATAYSIGQEVWDGTNIEIAIYPGTSGGSAPTWPAIGSTVTDGTTTPVPLTWKNLGPPFSMGASQGGTTVHIGPKIEPVMIDQSTGRVDAIQTEDEMYVETTLVQSQMDIISKALATAGYVTGTDTGLPSGAQNYQKIDTGGLVTVQGIATTCFPCVSVVSPIRGTGTTNPPKRFFVATLYAAYASDVWQVGWTRTKEAVYKVKFEATAQLWRTIGKQLGQVYKQSGG